MLGEADEGPIGIVDEAGLRNGNGSCANEPSFSTQMAEHRFVDSSGGEYRLHGYFTSKQYYMCSLVVLKMLLTSSF